MPSAWLADVLGRIGAAFACDVTSPHLPAGLIEASTARRLCRRLAQGIAEARVRAERQQQLGNLDRLLLITRQAEERRFAGAWRC